MNNYISTLNKEQYEAATTIDGHLFVLAGAGSGKTRVLIARTAYMIESGINPKNILLVTFTNKAANEMKERIKNWIGDAGSGVTACTFHSFCSMILRRYYKEAGLPADFIVLDSSDQESAIKTCINDYLNQKKEEGKKYTDFFKPYLIADLQSIAINESISIDKALEILLFVCPEYSDFKSEIREVYDMFTEFKIQNKAIDFDDLQYYAKLLLTKNEGLRRTLDGYFRYISCDEYQDTNKIQNEVLELLSKDHPNLAVVGDDNQSIYKFRGARVENILSFSKLHPDCKYVVLNQNYRSTQEILDTANAVMNQATEGIPKTLVSADNKHGQLPTLVRLFADYEEPDYILKTIKENKLDLSKTAVIYRSNQSSYGLESALNRAGIPYDKRGGMRFSDKKSIKDILALIRVATDPRDEIAAIRILPLIPGIGGTSARKIATDLKNYGINVLFSDKYKNKKFGGDLAGVGGALKALANMPLRDCVKTATTTYIGLRRYALSKSKAEQSSIISDRYEIAEAEKDSEILQNMTEGYKSVSQFVSDLSLEKRRKKEKGNCIVLTTIHSAKGLEWDNVFIIDCVEGILPSSAAEREGDIPEELRCFYVAITRAKHSLYVLIPNCIRGDEAYQTRFINETVEKTMQFEIGL